MTKATQDRATVKGGKHTRKGGCKTTSTVNKEARAVALWHQYPKEGCVLPIPKDKASKAALWGNASWVLQPLTASCWLDHINHKHVIVTFVPDSVMAWDIDKDHTQEAVLTGLRFLASHGLNAVATPSTSGQGWHVYAFFASQLDKDHAKEAAYAVKNSLERVLGGIDRVYPSGAKLTALGRHEVLTAHGSWLQDHTQAPKNHPKDLDAALASMGSRLTRWLLGGQGGITKPRKKPASKITSTKPPKKPASVTSSMPVSKKPASQLMTSSTAKEEARAHVLRDIRHAVSKASQRPHKAAQGLQEAVTRLSHAQDLIDMLELLVDVYPRSASYRHNLVLRVAPLLYRWGLNQEEATQAVLLVAKHAKDKEAKDRVKAVATSYNRLELGMSVCQIPSKKPVKTAFCAVAWGQDLRKYRKEARSRVALYRVLLASIAHTKKTTPKKLEHDLMTSSTASQQDHDPIDATLTPSPKKKRLSTRALSEITGVTRKTVSKTVKEAINKGLLTKDATPTSKGQNRLKRLKIVLGVNTILTCDTLDKEEAKRLERYRQTHAKERGLYRQGWHHKAAQEASQCDLIDANKEAQRYLQEASQQEAAYKEAQRYLQEASHHDLITKEEAQDPIDSQPAHDLITPSTASQPAHDLITPSTASQPAHDPIDASQPAHDPIDASQPAHDLITPSTASQPASVTSSTANTQRWLSAWLDTQSRARWHQKAALDLIDKASHLDPITKEEAQDPIDATLTS